MEDSAVAKIINDRAMGSSQWAIVITCALAMAVDGFDAQAIGYVAPALIKDLGLERALLGPLFTAGVLGMGLGNLLLGMVSDRLGRKRVLVACLLGFAGLTLAKSAASSFEWLVALQFLAGLGIGGAYPNAIALTSEYVPASRRSNLVTLCSLGYLAGTTLGGFLAATMIPSVGWRSVFLIGGGLPLIVAVAAWRVVPESLDFLIRRGNRRDDIVKVLSRVAPDVAVSPSVHVAQPVAKHAQSSIGQLFQEGRAVYTVLIWLTVPMTLISIYFVFSWLPTLFAGVGIPLSLSVLAATAFPIGSAVSSLALAPMLRRRWSPIVLSGTCAVFAAALALMGHVTQSVSLLMTVVFFAGLGSGVQGITHALNVAVYPAAIRSTAVGWATGIGRIGSVFGPLLGGLLVGKAWSTTHILYAAAIPTLIACVATALLFILPSPRRTLTRGFSDTNARLQPRSSEEAAENVLS